MKVLLLGGTGMLGYELRPALCMFAEVLAPSRKQADLRDPTSIEAVFDAVRPTIVVNAAAYNDVEAAERDPAEAMAVNRDGVASLAALCAKARVGLVHFSTDYVFGGDVDSPYREDDPVCPVNAYGRSKFEGERAIFMSDVAAFIFRTSWLYSLRRPCFVSNVLERVRTSGRVEVVGDQCGSPTWARDLAVAVALILIRIDYDSIVDHMRERAGIYHLAGGGPQLGRRYYEVAGVSRYELAKAIGGPLVHQVDQQPEAWRAPRPRYSALDCQKAYGLFGVKLPPWEDSLRRALEALP